MRHTADMDLGDDRGRQRVADAIRARRTELGLTQPDVTTRGGPSKALLHQIESAHPKGYDDYTIRRLEQALDWEPGSIQDIVDGREPTPVEHQEEPSPAEDPRVVTVAAGGWRVDIHPNPNATAEEIARGQDELVAAMLEKIRKLGFTR